MKILGINGLSAILAPLSSLRPAMARDDEGVQNVPSKGQGVKTKGASVTDLTLSVDIP